MGMIVILLAIVIVKIFVFGPDLVPHWYLALLCDTLVVVGSMTVESLLTIKVGLLHTEETEDTDQSAEACVEELSDEGYSLASSCHLKTIALEKEKNGLALDSPGLPSTPYRCI